MTLITEEMPEVDAPSEAAIRELLSSDAFGKFAILSASDDTFIQIASAWDPTPACQAFLKEHRSDPWILEIRTGGPATHLRVRGFVTLEIAQRAFQDFMRGHSGWQQAFEWDKRPHND
jgi:hypothetical protein